MYTFGGTSSLDLGITAQVYKKIPKDTITRRKSKKFNLIILLYKKQMFFTKASQAIASG